MLHWFSIKIRQRNIANKGLLEKTKTTFQACNMLLQQEYHKHSSMKYPNLISCLLVAKQNNKLLIKKTIN